MTLFDEIGKKLTQTGQDVVRKTKDFADITKINSKIDAEKRNINKFHMQIGYKYYQLFSENPDVNMVELCTSIKEAMEKISDYQEQIKKIKDEGNCLEYDNLYESNVQEDNHEKFRNCVKCGKELRQDANFCTGCGQKVN